MILLATALAIAATSVPAASTGASRELATCLGAGDAARGVTAAMKACTDAEYRRRDAVLNRLYQAQLRALQTAHRGRLRVAQRQWIRARDAACLPLLAPDTGSLGGLDYLDCMIDQTNAQVRKLAALR